jgi:hypothetical protein
MARHHAKRGKKTEHFLDVVHAGYEARGVASITRNHPEMAIVGQSGAGVVCIFKARGAPDFHAQVGAISLYFDAKEEKGDRWNFSHLEEHQARKMDRHQAQHANARAGLVIRLPDEGAAWFVPWSAIGPRWWLWKLTTGRARPGTASADVTWLDAYGVRLNGLDWLKAQE